MRRRLAIVALTVAATLPAARLSAGARARQAPAAQPSTPVQTTPGQTPPAPAGQPSPPPQTPDKPVPKPFPAPDTKQATPEKTPGAEPGALVFGSNAGMVFSPIKPDQESAYEEVLGKVQEALAKSGDPVRKQQAASWKVYKATEPFQGNTLYIAVMDPAVKDANYNVFPILQEAYGDVAAREIFEKFRNAHAGGQNITNVNPVFLMATGKVALPTAKAPD
jgi:hypothetical protein